MAAFECMDDGVNRLFSKVEDFDLAWFKYEGMPVDLAARQLADIAHLAQRLQARITAERMFRDPPKVGERPSI